MPTGSDDIVTRLRDVASLRGNIGGSVIPVVCTEAADEIERLRADRDRWRDLAEYLCLTVPSVVVPNEIASRFPDPLAVRGE